MAIVFHEADDDHAPFPHRVVITYEHSFVICAQCDHWIARYLVRCDCEYKCHELGELLAELAVNEVEFEGRDQEDGPDPERQDRANSF